MIEVNFKVDTKEFEKATLEEIVKIYEIFLEEAKRLGVEFEVTETGDLQPVNLEEALMREYGSVVKGIKPNPFMQQLLVNWAKRTGLNYE